MSLRIQVRLSLQRTCLSSVVRLKRSSKSDLRRGVRPRFPVQCKHDSRSELPSNLCYAGHASPILCASFSPTGNLLATGAGDCNARLWDLNTETPSHVLSGHKGWVLCVEWEGMERRLATGGHDGHVRLWDPKTGKPLGDALKGHTKWVTSLAWEPIHM